MSEENSNQTTCVSCGQSGDDEKITDKLKFKNKINGTVYIHYKADGKNGMLCRNCREKNIKQFHQKIEHSNKKHNSLEKESVF